MSSTTTLVAKQYRLQEWARQVQECNNRPENMSMDEWCQSVGLTRGNFYYRMRKVREALLDEIETTELNTTPIVPVSQTLVNEIHSPSSLNGIDITYRELSIHVTETTSTDLLSNVLKVIRHVE